MFVADWDLLVVGRCRAFAKCLLEQIVLLRKLSLTMRSFITHARTRQFTPIAYLLISEWSYSCSIAHRVYGIAPDASTTNSPEGWLFLISYCSRNFMHFDMQSLFKKCETQKINKIYRGSRCCLSQISLSNSLNYRGDPKMDNFG